MTAQHQLITVASVAVIAALVLMAMRISSAMSFAHPMHVITSGWEQESLFAIWRHVYGKDVYTDPYDIPYSIAFFNWLFYEAYGTAIAIVKSILDLGDGWIPTIGRWVTLLGLFSGVAVSYCTLLVVTDARTRALKRLFLLLSIYLMFGPLVGFWGFTVRSDIWGMVLDISAVFLFWRFYPRRPYLAASLAAIALFGAWSFKQIDVFSAIAIGLFLLFHLKIRVLAVLTGVYILLVAAVLVIGSEEFINTIFLRPAIYGFDMAHLTMNFKNFVVKSTPTLFPLAVIAGAMAFSPSIRKAMLVNPAVRFVVIAFLPLFALSLFISSKNGAAENYYFIFSFYCALGVAMFLKILLEDKTLPTERCFAVFRRGVVYMMLLGWGISAAALLSVFVGFIGVMSVQPTHDYLSGIRACLHEMPTPVYVRSMYASLPWMNPSSTPIVLSWNYRLERKLGLPFKHGGVGGLIEAGYFNSILFLKENEEMKIDGASLDGYKLAGEEYHATSRRCDEHLVLIKK